MNHQHEPRVDRDRIDVHALGRGAFLGAASLWLAGVAWAAPLPQEPTPTVDPAGGTPPQEEAKKGQEEPPKKQDDKDLEELNPFDLPAAGGGGSEDEMAELFMKVDKRLKRVSELLFEASTGDPGRAKQIGSSGIDELIRAAESSSGAGASGIAQLLEATRLQSEAAETEIDRILELAAQNQSQSSSSSGSPNQPPSSSGDMPQQGKTPSGSRKEEKGASPPQGEGQKPEQGQEQKDGETPTGNQEQQGSEDGPGKLPPGAEIGDPSNATGNEEWGDLPVHLRKVFQNGVSDDVPPRYRDWVDAYHKRLNRRGGR